MRNYLVPPRLASFERQQRARFLHIALWVIGVACLVIAAINFPIGATTFVELLILTAAICLAAVVLNHHGRYLIAALFLNSLLWLVAVFNLYDGAGLSDPGIAVFPMLIVLAGFLFRPPAVAYTVLFSCLTVWGLFLGDQAGWFELNSNPNFGRASILSIVYIVCGVLYWTISENWERTLFALRESYDLTLEGWARVLELRDFETRGHSERVERLAIALAEALGCTPTDIRQIRRGAYLHDIGKIAIRDELLYKEGDLSETEWEEMRRHPELGVQMVANIPFLEPTHPNIYSHHERWDGRGYPEGLQGENIPHWARIFALVDQWDALNSDRPYRKAWPKEKVISYFKENTGVIFDPQMVPVFLALVEQEIDE